MPVEWLKINKHRRKGKLSTQSPTVITHFRGNPYTQSARHGVTGFRGKVSINFEGEIDHFMRELESMKEIAVAKEVDRNK